MQIITGEGLSCMFSQNKNNADTLCQQEYGLALARLKILNELHILKRSAEKPAILEKLQDFDNEYLNNDFITQYISLEELWKLGVDAQDHACGRLAYDTGKNTRKWAEAGYIDAMETALAFMFRTADHELTSIFIGRLRFLCCCGVKLEGGDGYSSHDNQSEQDGGSALLKERNNTYTKYLTKEGLAEIAGYTFLETFTFKHPYTGKYIILNTNNVDEFLQHAKHNRFSFSILKEELNSYKIMENFISEYQQDIKKATNDDDRILAIATLVKKIECAHFFRDGNLRTVRLLVLKLLIQNKLPLTCILDPFMIDGQSSQQIAGLIKEGMEIYKNLNTTVNLKIKK